MTPHPSRIALALLGAGAICAALASPAAAQEAHNEEDSGEILQVAYPEGPLVLSDLVPGGNDTGHAVVTNTSDEEFEVLVTSTWPDTATADAGVALTAEICADGWLAGECTAHVQTIDLRTDLCAIDIIEAGGTWDIQFNAALPEGADQEAQGLSSPFRVDFSVADEVYENITGKEAEPAVKDCREPDASLLADKDEPSEPIPQQTTEQPAERDGPATSAQQDADEGLASTGSNNWAWLLLALALVVTGSVLAKRRRGLGDNS